jgi:hypothetical protein
LLLGLEEEVQTGRAALGRALASEAQAAELLAGKGDAIAGAGTRTVLKDASRLAAEYGGTPADWSKITSSHYTPPGSAGAQTGSATHAYQNIKTGQIVEMKSVPDQMIDETSRDHNAVWIASYPCTSLYEDFKAAAPESLPYL